MFEIFYAYPHDKIEIEAVMRLHAVKRWHMIDTTRIQTLAEHTANVALAAYVIAATAPGMFFGPSHKAAMCGLFHDLEEVFTGDIPAHTKQHLSGVDDLEQEVLPKMFKDTFDTKINLLVKLCDLADGIRFVRLHGVDATATHAQNGLWNQFQNKCEEVESVWPKNVYRHVRNWLLFYIYEES
jgi:hypothetical protein